MNDSSNNDLNSKDLATDKLKLIHDTLAEHFGKPVATEPTDIELKKAATEETNPYFLYNACNYSAGIIFYDVNS